MTSGGLFWRSDRRGQSQRLHHGVMQGRPNFGNFLVFARGMDTIREQHHEELFVWINPDGGSGVSCVAKSVWSHKVSAGSAFRRNRPANRSEERRVGKECRS